MFSTVYKPAVLIFRSHIWSVGLAGTTSPFTSPSFSLTLLCIGVLLFCFVQGGN